jgi:hypothetical protein
MDSERRRNPRTGTETFLLTIYSTWDDGLRIHKGPEGSFDREVRAEELQGVILKLWIVGNVVRNEIQPNGKRS